MKELIKFEEAQLIIPKCHISKNKLEFKEALTFIEWKEIGKFLKGIEGSVQFWIGDWLNFGKKKYEHGKYEEALQELGYELRSLQQFSWVSEKIESSRRLENLDYSHHMEVAPLLPEEQDKWLNKAEQEHLSIRELREQIKEARKPELISLPEGKYNVIYADPPWPIDSMVLDKWESPLTDKYEIMTIEEIKILNVSSLAADDCSLFLWTTHKYLKEAFEVIDSWGFKYHCCITWDKGSGWSLCGFHRITEFCLYAYKGKINIFQTGKFIPTLIKENKREHSRKPEIMYELIESHTPNPRIELFARKERNEWKSWGNQI